MRILILTTHTNNTLPLYEPLRGLGNTLYTITYDRLTANEQDTLPEMVRNFEPDWVLYIGAIPEYHNGLVPTVEILTRIGKVAPLVHLCCDGAEYVWWPLLQQYEKAGTFKLQINIDGVRTGPIGETGLTMLTPIDPVGFPDKPWRQREIGLGFAGQGYGRRAELIDELRTRNVLTCRQRDGAATATDYRQFLSNCRAVLNHPDTGTGTSQHVKGRVLEAALAGCILFELRGSPTEQWFIPHVDYLPYDGPDDLIANLDWIAKNPDKAETMARRLQEKVRFEHSPAVFWAAIKARLGFTAPSSRTELLKQPWHISPLKEPLIARTPAQQVTQFGLGLKDRLVNRSLRFAASLQQILKRPNVSGE